MENNNIKVKGDVIIKCGTDKVIPFIFMYMFYVVLHGHLSPGGGFQGGVLMVAAIAFIYMGYGYEGTAKCINRGFLHKFEGFASIAYIFFAMLGVFGGAYFCENVLFDHGNIGDLYSTGTIFYMNVTVGAKVLAGVGVLGLTMLGLLAVNDDDEKE